jgi:CrcB protein
MKPPRLSFADILFIGLGGTVGSLLRTWVGAGFDGAFPVPTLFINLLGAAALAILHTTQHRLHPQGKYLYMVGFCGSFTTVSLFSHETVQLLQDGSVLLGLAYVAASLLPALLLVAWILHRWDPLIERKST